MPRYAHAITAAFCLVAAAGASAQVVINEVITNPPGSGSIDNLWEFIELYGTPGMSLNGYAIGFMSGGMDHDNDGIPSRDPLVGDPGDEFPEMDEVFQLDGLTIGSNGMLVLYNTTGGGSSSILPLLPSATNRRTLRSSHIPSSDVANRIKNYGSMTVLLVRNRPFYTFNGTQSIYDGQTGFFVGTRYAFRKDTNPDVNFNSRIDRGVETPVPPTPDPVQVFIPLQIIDEVAWSHEGGKEYVTTTQHEISDTPGFNPDAVTRLAYYGPNPRRGHRFNSDNIVVSTRNADEEFVYGELRDNGAGVVDPALKFLAGSVKGPTNTRGPRYDGSCNPDTNPGCTPSNNGLFRFQDINLTEFGITPGNFNDVDSSGVGGIAITQFRFVPGDFDFNGGADAEDLHLIHQRLGAGPNDTILVTDDNNTPTDPLDDFTYTGWRWQTREFNGLMAMMNMVTNDGSGGANAPTVTAADIAVAANVIQNALR